jgi:hypothetical protein
MSYSRTQPSTEPEMTVGPEKTSEVIESRASVSTWIGERFCDLKQRRAERNQQ